MARSRGRSLLVATWALAATPALADELQQPFTASGDAIIVSDYRYRGLSLSDRRPALQADVTAATPSGIYGSLFASTINYGTAHHELDLIAGDKVEIAGLSFDLSAVRYVFPGGRNLGYWELPVAVSKSLGSWVWTGSVAYVPAQSATRDQANRYGYVRGQWQPSGSANSVAASVGYENGAFARRKIDWSLTATRRMLPLEWSLSVIGSHETKSAVTLIGSFGAGF